jgi:protein-disulfide isomerase
MIRPAAALLVAVLAAETVPAEVPECAALSGDERRTADGLLATEHLYDCCDDTVERCLAAEPTCRLAVWLAADICRRVAAGQDGPRIRRALSRRARSMIGGGTPAEIDLEAAAIFGPDDAPVTVTIYACARCPYCSQLIPRLYRAVDDGPLVDDVRLAFRVFPIRGHEGSTPAGLGFAAAQAVDRFWPFMLQAYRHFDDFSETAQIGWADDIGIDRAEFEALLRDPATRESLVASKKEGLVNGVEATPTLFLNGRMWVGDLEYDELLSAIFEEAARARGDLWLEN